MGINSNKIAKNSIYLYIRLAVNMILTLYSSRILLQALGVEDFGVYGVVGGIAAMFSSLRSSFACAIQRFYNFEIGTNDDPVRMKSLFNTGFIIHLILALVLVLLLEVVGTWLVGHKLSFPEGRVGAAFFVFHCTVITTFFTTLCIPFDGLILARERMSFFAGLSIFDTIIKFIAISLLLLINENRLYIYAVVLVAIQCFNLLCNIIYCRRNFKECRFSKSFDKTKVKELSVFAGWGFFGNLAFTIGNEVSNFFLNIFGGVVYNASRQIAYQVKAAVMSLLANGMVALRPQTMQLYAAGNIASFYNVIYFSSKVLFFMALLMATPIIIYVDNVLLLWLGSIPESSDIFISLIMVQVLIRSFHEPIDIVFKSTGRLKNYQFASLVSTLLILPFSYICLKLGYPLYSVFVLMIIMEFIEWVLIVTLARKEGLSLYRYFIDVVIPCTLLLLFSVGFYILHKSGYFQHIHFLIGIFIIEFVLLFLIFLLGFTKKERSNLFRLLSRKSS